MAGAWTLLAVCVVLSLLVCSVTSTVAIFNRTHVFAVLSREVSIDRSALGELKLLPDVPQKLQLIGVNFGEESEIAFTPENKQNCDSSKRTGAFRPTSVNSKKTSAVFDVVLDKLDPGEEKYYLCVKQALTWEFQGAEPWQQIAIKEVNDENGTIFPVPVQVVILTFLLFLSGLFSGLNLGLMALDKTELQIIERCGSHKEKKFAKTIRPLRKRGNFLLCTLLLGNVMVNSTATILLDDLSNGVVAVVASTISIVVFGEIIPQAVCSRHGLAVGAKTAWITRFFMLVTFPLSFPISLLLDRILGEEIGQVYDKEKLQELIRMTADHKVLQSDEANIIAGALQLATKRVEDVMTKMDDVYMLDVNTVLNFDMMSQILKSGFTRVPVYDGDKTNIVHLLNTKELALIDPDDNTPLKTVCRFYDHQPLFVDYDMKLDAMLQEFLQGSSHLAIVQCLQNEGDHDPYFENIGVVTLEDVIEEIIQSEIIDETDNLTDNRGKKPRQHRRQLEYNVFDSKREHGPKISQQVAFAAYQFLSTAVEPFKEHYIVRSVLKQLIRQNIFITVNPSLQDDHRKFLYTRGKPCDYFILLLEGHVEVEIGRENLVFESGPFSYFGVESLDCLREIKMESFHDSKDLRALPHYIPDFSVRAITPVQFLRIRRVHYLAAKRTSCMLAQRGEHGETTSHEEAFHNEWLSTQAASAISRNSSATGMLDAASVGLSPLEMVQKRALLSEGSLKEKLLSNGFPSRTASGGDLVEEKDVSPTEGPKSTSASNSDLTAEQKHKLRSSSSGIIVEVSVHIGDPASRKGSSPQLPRDFGGGDVKAVSSVEMESDSSPEEGSVGEQVEDKVPLMKGKEHKTHTAVPKMRAEGDDDSDPLVTRGVVASKASQC